MKNTPDLYDTWISIFGQHEHWHAQRHFQTLAWMIVGLVESGLISLTGWAPFTVSRAQYAQSIVRRFRRWLDNERVQVHDYYLPLIQEALKEWSQQRLYVAFDTSQLWGRFCIIRLSLVDRGRAVPLVWTVIEHASSSVAFEIYRPLLAKAQALIPAGCRVVFLADRGFADTALMTYLRDTWQWHWRIRIKSNFLVDRPGKRRVKIEHISLKRGQARFWHGGSITADQFGPVHLALAQWPQRNLADCQRSAHRSHHVPGIRPAL